MIWSILTGVLTAVTICLVAELRKRDNQIYNLKQAEKYSRFKEDQLSNTYARLEETCGNLRARYDEARGRWDYWSRKYDAVNKELSGLLVTVESLHRMRDKQTDKIKKLKEDARLLEVRYAGIRHCIDGLCEDPKKYRIDRGNGRIKLFAYYSDGIAACVKALEDTDENFTELETLQGTLGREENI